MMRLVFALCALAMVTGCEPSAPSSDRKMNAAQERLSSEANAEVGLPAIRNFQEKRMMKTIFELRDQAISTTTYLVTLDAKLVKFCDSVGYGLPYATQYTNPMRAARSDEGGTHDERYALPQSDPNGLFSPASADGTWVLCLDPKGKQAKPVYVEPHVVVSPFPLLPEASK